MGDDDCCAAFVLTMTEAVHRRQPPASNVSESSVNDVGGDRDDSKRKKRRTGCPYTVYWWNDGKLLFLAYIAIVTIFFDSASQSSSWLQMATDPRNVAHV